ncbi:MAG: ATP-binding cassette domain-containing protein [Planctomycetes bacterium]|nr:ATP-binding cassette domain-containing protein [Planctomycetota bacterium]
MNGSAPHFELRELAVSYGAREVLRVPQLALERGSLAAIVGPSGAGKTTLLRVLGLALRPSAGELRLDGRAVPALRGRALRAQRAALGFVHQELALVPGTSVLHNVLCGRLGRSTALGALRTLLYPSRAERSRAHALLERLGIAELLYRDVEQLSGGERQRVAIARALAQEPEALLVDEPIASVDPARGRAVLELLLELARERGLTLVASLHHVELARELFPRVIGLRAGSLALDGPSELLDARAQRELFALAPGAGHA